MEKLSALDANFLYTESARMPNHISSVQLFELPEATSADQFIEGLKKKYLERIHILPYLTRKVLFMPGNLDHPVWVTDNAFDINNHIFRVDLPPPGNMAQLEQKVAEIHAELIDRDKPLWQLFVICGVEGNRIAYYSQAHHACIDGMAGQAATLLLLDTTPEGQQFSRPANFPEQEHPGLTELIGLSVENFLKTQISAPKRMLDAMESMSRVTSRWLDKDRPLGTSLQLAPKTRFNRAIEKPRTYAMADFAIHEVKAVAKATDSKLNDILLAICAEGLRNYLLRTNELPDKPLIAACPVSLRQHGDQTMNNQVTMMSVNLFTNLADRQLRLNAIKSSAATAKQLVADTRQAFDTDVAVFGLPAMIVGSSRLAESMHLMDNLPTTMNLVISNVAGPPVPLYSNGVRMLTHYPVSIPAHGMGVNITAVSYVDTLHLAITACAKALPDAGNLRDDIVRAFAELKSGVLKSDLATGPRKPSRARPKSGKRPAAASRKASPGKPAAL